MGGEGKVLRTSEKQCAPLSSWQKQRQGENPLPDLIAEHPALDVIQTPLHALLQVEPLCLRKGQNRK